MQSRRPCERGDLRCWVPVANRYTVDYDGNTIDFMDSTADDTSGIDEYGCWNCGEYWPIEDRYDEADRKAAWGAAVAHLLNPEAA